MGDMGEYYHQISEIQKAVREREIHRLQLEKQILMKTHKRNKRYEELQDKIKEVQKELVQEELKATQRYQSLLAQVDALRREHDLLAAHTERLRQKKRQYEMHIANTYSDLQYKIQGDKYHYFQNSVGAPGRNVSQQPYTPVTSLPTSQPVIVLQSHISPITSSSSSTSSQQPTKPPGSYLPQVYMNYPAYEQQLLHPNGIHLQTVGQKETSIRFTSPHTGERTYTNTPAAVTSGATNLFNSSAQYCHLGNINDQSNSVSDIIDTTPSGDVNQPLNESQNAVVAPHDFNSFIPVSHVETNHSLHNVFSEVQPSQDLVTGDAESIALRNISIPDHLTTQDLHSQQLHNNPLQNPISRTQCNQMGNRSHAHLPENPTLPSSINSQYDSSKIPAVTAMLSLPESVSSPKSLTHTQFLEAKLSEVSGHGSVMKNDEILHQTPMQTTNESEYNLCEVQISGRNTIEKASTHSVLENVKENQNANIDAKEEEASVEQQLSNALNNQPLLLNSNLSTSDLNGEEQTSENEKENVDMSASGIIIDSEKKLTDSTANSLGDKCFAETLNINKENRYQRISNESLPACDGGELPAHSTNDNTNKSHVTKDAQSALPSKETCQVNLISSDAITNNNNIVTASQKKHCDTALTASMDSTVMKADVDAPQSSVVHIKEEPSNLIREDELKKTSHQSVESKSSSSELTSPEKIDQHSHRERNNIHNTNENESGIAEALHLKVSAENQEEEEDSDFFDRDVVVTATAAYRSLVGNTLGDAAASLGTESESDEVEGQMSSFVSKQQTQSARSTFKPFASSIPSLRPQPPETDTDSVDSVEAAIQAALKNKKDQPSDAAPPAQPRQLSSQGGLRSQPVPESPKEIIKPGIGITHNKMHAPAALQLNLASDSESYGVSAGEDGSDDDFDFYDKL
ncbi:hypothetical protein OTU49_003871 [Cherax quadricarinatus]|uniref:Centrosomal protein kizuna n=3 Tax=Cherax quadricarinatus TaxID=27406 RepID=A0AAW0XGG5_CHEQU